MTLIEILNKFFIKDIIPIIQSYVPFYNKEKYDRESDTIRWIPHSIDIHNNLLYVSYTMDNQICIFNKNSMKLVYTFGTLGRYIDWNIDVDTTTYYIIHNLVASNLNQIFFDEPRGLAIDDNILYVVDSHNYRIQMFKIYDDKKIRFCGLFGKYGCTNGEFKDPKKIKIVDDKIYVTDEEYKIKIFNKKTYTPITQFYCPFKYKINDITIDENFIFISHSLPIVDVYDKKFLDDYGVFKKINQINYNYPNSIISTSDDEIFIMSLCTKSIQIFNKISMKFIRSIKIDRRSPINNMIIHDKEIYVVAAGELGCYICALGRFYDKSI
jgi:hypothetical protein